MPLPDERPRGSVANLIGRFENQVKRQPSSSPASARSLSATSHVSGDSAKEEAKERREWPPKSTSPDVKPPITVPSSSFAHSLALAQAASAEAIPAADVTEDASLTPRSHSTMSSNPDKLKHVITTPPQQQLSIDVVASAAATAGTPTTAKPLTTAKPPPAKTPAQATGRTSTMTPGRTLLKSTGIRPAAAPASHPIKPQNTGPSNPSVFTRKAVTKLTHPPSTSASIARTATSARPKTPSSTQARTPSSGLFAPTAASLAKSRNAQQSLVSSSPKKAALSSAAAERLSKPTAASLSRMRTQTTAIPHASTKSTASATRGTPAIKLKTSATKQVGIALTGKKAAAAATGPEIAAATEPKSISEGIVVPPEESEHQVDDNHIDEILEDAISSEKLLPEQGGSSCPAMSIQTDAEAITIDGDLNGETVEANNEAGVVYPGKIFGSHDALLEHVDKAEMAHVNGGHEPEIMPKTHIGNVNEIEDMVNLLESISGPKVRPESLASIPDEGHEILST